MKKLKKVLSIILISTLICSCNFVSNKNGNSSKENDGVSIRKTYFEKSGGLKSEISVKDGKKNGPAKKYYATGELHTLMYYKNNKKVDSSTWYYKNGQAYRVTNYVNGKMHGTRKIYYENGKLQAEIPYENGEIMEGTKEYDSKGNLIEYDVKIQFQTKDLLASENKYILLASLSKSSHKVEFFEERTTTEGTIIRAPLRTENKIGKIFYYIPEGSSEKKTVKVYAKVSSDLGNPILIGATYNLNVKN